MNDLMQFIELLFLFKIFIIKKYAEFSLTFFGTLKYDCVIETIEMVSVSNKQFSYYWI